MRILRQVTGAAAGTALLWSTAPAAALPPPPADLPPPAESAPEAPPLVEPAPVARHANVRGGNVPSGNVPSGNVPSGNVPSDKPWYRLRGVAELGFLAVLSHRLQFGQKGTYFDYVGEGGQDNLFAVSRFSVEAELFGRHQIVFLYQPLEINSRAELTRDLRVEDLVFPKGTPMDIKYGFPFYRLGYAYDVLPSPRHELSFGVGLQIRNATIEFASRDGSLLRSNHDIGLVPLLRARGRYGFESGAFIGFEADGFYAAIPGLNGNTNNVKGAILDASLRAGVRLPLNTEAFINLRYLGGGSEGQGRPEPPSDGFAKNWLNFLTVSLGASIASF